MDWNSLATVAVVGLSVVFIIMTRIAPELVLSGGVVALLVLGVISPAEALSGFANPGLVTVALMYIIAAAIRETGGVEFLVSHVLAQPRSTVRAQGRVMLPTVIMSAFLNNTPVVATFIPAVLSWSKRIRVSPSRLLLPLSYAAILGGTCTLVGTSTNLAVNGMLMARTGESMAMFDIAYVGVPVALMGLLYILLFGRRLLPARKPATQEFENPREYTVEMRVAEGGPLVGKTVEQAGLRHLQGLFLIEIDRAGRIIPSVASSERLQAGDHLVFAGVTESVVELNRIAGLQPTTQVFNLEDRFPERCLVEVAIAPQSQWVGKSIREGRFRSVFGASVLAVARSGERIQSKLGDIRLEPSDTLLLEADRSFVDRHRHSRDFLLISEVADSQPRRHDKAWISWGILLAVVLSAAFGLMPILNAALIGVGLVLITGCCSWQVARQALDGQVLLAIAAALALGQALESSSAAATLAGYALTIAGDNPWLLLALTYLITTLLTEVVTNNATAVLMFPVVMATTEAAGINAMPFIITIMMGASASFSTPLGYQTNLMVYGPGGYRFTDYTRFGLPLNFIAGVVTVTVAPMVWGF